MCIRDSIRERFASNITLRGENVFLKGEVDEVTQLETIIKELKLLQKRQGKITCLLYTSDAADERSSVDLGGRRIIKKKKTVKLRGGRIE